MPNATTQLPDLQDEGIVADIEDVLAHDIRLSALSLKVGSIGGVVRLAGEVPTEARRTHLREVAAKTRNVRAVWDQLKLSGESALVVLDIGCGPQKQTPDAIGVDRAKAPGVDLLADLEKPLPFAENVADHVFAVHVLEHIVNLGALMSELHRVLKPSGVLHTMVPNWQTATAVGDPTHVRFFNLLTFKYFCRDHGTLPLFTPVCAYASASDIFADLQAVKPPVGPAPEKTLAKFFD